METQSCSPVDTLDRVPQAASTRLFFDNKREDEEKKGNDKTLFLNTFRDGGGKKNSTEF